MTTKAELKPLNSIIQVCPDCGKVDVYKNDGHDCDRGVQEQRESDIWD
ncbi:MAG: hypothetical protein KAJ24_03160 [Candidatus Aenigmarchaeota archaeon]|nr:hypothetical protein [Candidatus Aenigmarchaeota archaeon]